MLLAVAATQGGAFAPSPRTTATHAPRPTPSPRTVATQSALFDDDALASMAPAELQAWMRRDIGRRRAELVLLGWLGRAWLAVPALFEALAPAVFRLEPYEDEELVYETSTTVECVLKESSVVGRGVPIRFRLGRDAQGAVVAAELVAVGCDLTPSWPNGAEPMGRRAAAVLVRQGAPPPPSPARPSHNRRAPPPPPPPPPKLAGPHHHHRHQCERVNERSAKRVVVEAFVAAIFYSLEPLFKAAGADGGPSEPAPLQPTSDTAVSFTPRRDLWAREGSTEKWLQKTSAVRGASRHATQRNASPRHATPRHHAAPPARANPHRTTPPRHLATPVLFRRRDAPRRLVRRRCRGFPFYILLRPDGAHEQ